jgi:FkbM family methyltransferase
MGISDIVRKYVIKYKMKKSGWEHQNSIQGFKTKFKTSNRYEWKRAKDLVGEEEVIEDMLTNTNKDDIFFDIGAAVGTYSCFVGKKIQNGNGRIVAFEPTKENYNRLKENVKLNSLESEATLLKIALSDENGTTQIFLQGEDTGQGGHSLVTESETGSEVKMRRGDTLISEGQPSADVLKIDVEGAELQVLRGLQQTLKEIRLIYCELHPTRVSNIESEVKDFLHEHGFETKRLGSSRNHIKAVNGRV